MGKYLTSQHSANEEQRFFPKTHFWGGGHVLLRQLNGSASNQAWSLAALDAIVQQG